MGKCFIINMNKLSICNLCYLMNYSSYLKDIWKNICNNLCTMLLRSLSCIYVIQGFSYPWSILISKQMIFLLCHQKVSGSLTPLANACVIHLASSQQLGILSSHIIKGWVSTVQKDTLRERETTFTYLL